MNNSLISFDVVQKKNAFKYSFLFSRSQNEKVIFLNFLPKSSAHFSRNNRKTQMSVLYSAYKKTEPTFLLYEKLTQNLVNGKTNKCARKYN